MAQNDLAQIPYKQVSFSQDEMIRRSESFYQFMDKRRSVRDFSDKDVPVELSLIHI